MFTRLGLRRELIAYHEHNEIEAAERLVELLAEGKSMPWLPTRALRV